MKNKLLSLDKTNPSKLSMKREISTCSQTNENTISNLTKTLPYFIKNESLQSINENNKLATPSKLFKKKIQISYSTSFFLCNKDKCLINKNLIQKLPRIKPIKISLNPTINNVQKEIFHNLSQTNLFKRTTTANINKILENQVKFDISLLNKYNSKKVVEELFAIKNKERNALQMNELNIKNKKEIKHRHFKGDKIIVEHNDPILTVNPMINYQQMIDDSDIMYIFHNENLRKFKNSKQLKFGELFNN